MGSGASAVPPDASARLQAASVADVHAALDGFSAASRERIHALLKEVHVRGEMWQTALPLSASDDFRYIEIIGGEDIHAALPALKSVKQGWLNLFVRGSGIALSVNENCDRTVRSDLTQALERILPTPKRGAANVAADARALLMSTTLTLPITSGEIEFGTWQGLYLARFRADAHGDLILTLADGGSSAQADFTFDANKRQSHGIAAEVEHALNKESVFEATSPLPSSLLVHEKHTSASLSVAGTDLEPTMRVVVPEKWNKEFFEHTYEGPDDMPGHVKSTLLGCGVVIPLLEGRAALGPGQNVMLNEHRDVGGFGVGHTRRVQVTELPVGSRRLVEIPRGARGAGALIDITDQVSTVVAEASASGTTSPGLVHVFATSPHQGVIVAGATAAKVLAARLQDLITDSAARAAIAKNGPVLPLDERGRLLLGDCQRVWLYDATSCSTPVEAVLAESCELSQGNASRASGRSPHRAGIRSKSPGGRAAAKSPSRPAAKSPSRSGSVSGGSQIAITVHKFGDAGKAKYDSAAEGPAAT